MACAAASDDDADLLPPDQPEPERVERTWVDDGRGTPAAGDLPAEDGRTLDVVVWMDAASPEEQVERPLLLIAHGNGGDPSKMEAFATAVSRTGVAVAAVRFPRTSARAATGLAGAVDLPNQPGDLDFVLGRLAGAVASESDPLWRRFDPTHVTALGHSLGGATVLLWTRVFEDPPALDATMLLAPYTPVLATYGSVRLDGPPTLMVQGTADEAVAAEVNEAFFATLASPAWLVLLPGVDHSSDLEGSDPTVPQLAVTAELAGALVDEETVEPGALAAALDEATAGGAEVRSTPAP
jgi:predicted dienelactone hydrolase